MKVIHISTTGAKGGAGIAAYRLSDSLRKLGVDSRILSLDSGQVLPHVTVSEGVRQRNALELEFLETILIHRNRTDLSNTWFSAGKPGVHPFDEPEVMSADVIHLHWISGMFSPSAIADLHKTRRPIVWTLHDQWAFTGGCHYSAGCTQFQTGCGDCPQLRVERDKVAAALWNDKHRAWRSCDSFHFVTPSRWMLEIASTSPLVNKGKFTVIRNGISLELFSPEARALGRKRLGLEDHELFLLFSSQNIGEKRKGFSLLLDALAMAPAAFETPDGQRVIVGALGADLPSELSSKVKPLGWVEGDEELALRYAAADLFICPSLEDNQPNTMVEALACGTPLLAFPGGGPAELVTAGETGFLASARTPAALLEAIQRAISRPAALKNMRLACRTAAERQFDSAVQAQKYISVYDEALLQRPTSPRVVRKRSLGVGPHLEALLRAPHTISLKDVSELLYWKLHNEGGLGNRVSAPWSGLHLEDSIKLVQKALAQAQEEKDQSANDLRSQIAFLDADRGERGQIIENQGKRIAFLEAEVDRWLNQAASLQEQLVREKENAIVNKDGWIEAMRQHKLADEDREARGRVIEEQGQRIASLEAELDRWLSEVRKMHPELEQLRGERQNLELQLKEVCGHFENAEKDRASRGEVIERQGKRIAELEAMVDHWLKYSQSLLASQNPPPPSPPPKTPPTE